MTIEELFSLEDGTYEAYDDDLPHYHYVLTITSNKPGFKKWVSISERMPETLNSRVNITLSDNDYLFFSSESVPGLGVATSTEPNWFEYLKIKK